VDPYYRDELVTIFHARCEDVLPSIDPADVDLLLTDPPYGIDYDNRHRGGESRGRLASWKIAGDNAPFDPSHLLHFRRLVLWGGNNFADRLPASGSWLVWDKTPGEAPTTFATSNCELAWTYGVATRGIKRLHCRWSRTVRNGEALLHPTQKPVALMRWIVETWTEPGDLVLDPYMGSGPVAQACHELGRRYIGIEVVEDYCKVAVSRLAQQTLDLGLPA
jgi:site-specific DNA-methyltransferase (adenine-specific)